MVWAGLVARLSRVLKYEVAQTMRSFASTLVLGTMALWVASPQGEVIRTAAQTAFALEGGFLCVGEGVFPWRADGGRAFKLRAGSEEGE
jgi:hypothetical protein